VHNFAVTASYCLLHEHQNIFCVTLKLLGGIDFCSASDSAYLDTFFRLVVCLSVVCRSRAFGRSNDTLCQMGFLTPKGKGKFGGRTASLNMQLLPTYTKKRWIMFHKVAASITDFAFFIKLRWSSFSFNCSPWHQSCDAIAMTAMIDDSECAMSANYKSFIESSLQSSVGHSCDFPGQTRNCRDRWQQSAAREERL